MIINKESARALSAKDYATLADYKGPFVKEEIDEETGLKVRFLKNPRSLGSSSMAYITHAVVALREDDLIFSAQLEGLDLRELSAALGESVKTLQAEYGVRSYLTPVKMIVYGDGNREDIGSYLGSRDDSEIFEFLFSLFEDSFVEEDDEDYSDWIFDE